eukprot:354742-Chlamydomonas_euryale.AAC.1
MSGSYFCSAAQMQAWCCSSSCPACCSRHHPLLVLVRTSFHDRLQPSSASCSRDRSWLSCERVACLTWCIRSDAMAAMAPAAQRLLRAAVSAVGAAAVAGSPARTRARLRDACGRWRPLALRLYTERAGELSSLAAPSSCACLLRRASAPASRMRNAYVS